MKKLIGLFLLFTSFPILAQVTVGPATIQTIVATNLYPTATLPISVSCRNFSLGQARSTNFAGTSKFYVVRSCNINTLQLVYCNCLRQNGSGSVVTIFPATNSISIAASVLINDMLVPVFFGGARTNVLAAGKTVTSDPINYYINTNDTVYVLTWHDAGTSTNYPTAQMWGSGVSALAESTTTNNYVDGGTFPSVYNPYDFCPIAVLGTPVWSTNKSIGLYGDSIFVGAGDGNEFNTNVSPGGYMARACVRAGYGIANLSVGGEQLMSASTNLHYRVYSLAKGNKCIVCNLGINDHSNGRTFSQMTNDALNLWPKLKSTGLRIYQATLTPHTTSTNYWISTNDQTVTAYESVRTNFNYWLRNSAVTEAKGSLDGILDAAASAESTGRWLALTNQIIFSGVVASATTNTLVDTNCSIIPNFWTDSHCALLFTSGANAGICLKMGNTTSGNTITYYPIGRSSWPNLPVVGDTYQVVAIPTVDGLHPSYYGSMLLSSNVDVTQFK